MKFRNLIWILTSFLTVSVQGPYALAGAKEGGGGGAWVCRDSYGQLVWAKLVDLFEAQEEFGLTLGSYQGSYESAVDEVRNRLSASTFGSLYSIPQYMDRLNYLKASPQITYTHNTIPVIGDALYFLIPPASECTQGSVQYEQVVNYRSDTDIEVQADLFSSLPEIDKAALVVHEAVYALRRDSQKDTNSVVSRRIVGLAFSTMTVKELVGEFGALEMGRQALSPGTYTVSVEKVSSDGSITPMSNVSVMLWVGRDFCYESFNRNSGFGKTGTDGSVNLEFDGAVGSPRIEIFTPHDDNYNGPITFPGWAAAFSPYHDNQPHPLSCESITSTDGFSIHVICVDQPESSEPT